MDCEWNNDESSNQTQKRQQTVPKNQKMTKVKWFSVAHQQVQTDDHSQISSSTGKEQATFQDRRKKMLRKKSEEKKKIGFFHVK